MINPSQHCAPGVRIKMKHIDAAYGQMQNDKSLQSIGSMRKNCRTRLANARSLPGLTLRRIQGFI